MVSAIFGASLLLTPLATLAAAEPPSSNPNILVTPGGEVGDAAMASMNRFRAAPYDSLAWLRADLTGERVTEFDGKWGHLMNRPFKNYSGDISGRFIEIMALNSRGSFDVHPALRELLAAVPKYQRHGGYFAASGVIDWQQPIDFKGEGGGTMMPALWGNARLLCGLVEACRAFKDAGLLDCARKLGDFYLGLLPRFTDPAHMAEYTAGDTFAAGYVTCYFPAMEGLVKLHLLTGERKYLDAAITMAEFYRGLDRLPIDHAHGMLCNQVSLLLLFETTKQAQYLQRVEKRWGDLVEGGYINPAGGILEACQVKYGRDEGCAIVDWLRLNLELARVTGKARYFAMAERTLHNHFLQNQSLTGGFGHRSVRCDDNGVVGFAKRIEEATWCCTFHGQLGFVNLRAHLTELTDGVLTSNFALDFTRTDGAGTLVSGILPGVGVGEVLRQRIHLSGMAATVLRVRHPHWADAVTAIDADGKALTLAGKDGFFATTRPVTEAVFIFGGGLYAENRHCLRLPAGPVAAEPFVLGFGPKILASLGRTATTPDWPTSLTRARALGLVPFTAAMRTQDCGFGCR
ncbi:MAG: beta-L-arabinofuranosidase domain-containing protein [Verrucomicrobiota bacterium]